MTTMRCETVRDALPALARGTLGEVEAAQVRAHIAGCDECAGAWRVVGALAHASVAAPAGLADRVAAEVAHKRTVAPRRAASPMRWLGGGGWPRRR